MVGSSKSARQLLMPLPPPCPPAYYQHQEAENKKNKNGAAEAAAPKNATQQWFKQSVGAFLEREWGGNDRRFKQLVGQMRVIAFPLDDARGAVSIGQIYPNYLAHIRSFSAREMRHPHIASYIFRTGGGIVALFAIGTACNRDAVSVDLVVDEDGRTCRRALSASELDDDADDDDDDGDDEKKKADGEEEEDDDDDNYQFALIMDRAAQGPAEQMAYLTAVPLKLCAHCGRFPQPLLFSSPPKNDEDDVVDDVISGDTPPASAAASSSSTKHDHDYETATTTTTAHPYQQHGVVVLSKCGRCFRHGLYVWYCGKACQLAHYYEDGHRHVCGARVTGGTPRHAETAMMMAASATTTTRASSC